MVKVEQSEHAANKKQLLAISDGTLHRGLKSGIVQMTVRLSDMKSEGECVFFDVADETLEAMGDYTPLSFEKNELMELIEFLQDCYSSLSALPTNNNI